MGKKWFLRDWSNPQRIVKGTLTNVHRADDGDTNLMIKPASDDANQRLLINRNGAGNEDGVLECEINVGSDWKGQYENWARSLASTDSVQIEVRAQGSDDRLRAP